MKQITRLNYQLFLTFSAIVIGSIIAFGMILPISMRGFFDQKTYTQIIEVQKKLNLDTLHEVNGRDGIYHIFHGELILPLDISKEMSEELLHQRLMYKDFFMQAHDKALTEVREMSTHKYTKGNETIHYVINKKNPENVIISYKIDTKQSMIMNPLFRNTLCIITITIILILIIFFQWNKRLVDNLKDIQCRLDEIGDGNLVTPIQTEHYTIEFQEVMDSLETMRKKLYEDEQVKQDMMHNISHDLKTPLTVIKNYAEGIIDGVYPYGTVEETAHVIYNQAERLQKRVQSLLYLNRLEYIKSQKEILQPFDIKELVLEVCNYMQDKADHINIEVCVEDTIFWGDIEKWRIVVENLLDNAKRYAKSQIIIQLEKDRLSIYNDGPQIEEQVKGSLFKPFEVGKGGVTGLGLSIVKKTLELYQYNIIYSNKTEGVTFIIYKIT